MTVQDRIKCASARRCRLWMAEVIRRQWGKRLDGLAYDVELYVDGEAYMYHRLCDIRESWYVIGSSEVVKAITKQKARSGARSLSEMTYYEGYSEEVQTNLAACQLFPFVTSPAWRNETTRRVARAIYADRDWESLPILRDALIDAGCEDQAVLRHCDATMHGRGCFVLEGLR